MKTFFLLFLFLISIQYCDTMQEVKIDSEPDSLVRLRSGTFYFYFYNSKGLNTIYFNFTDADSYLDNSHIEVCYTDEYPSYFDGFPSRYERKQYQIIKRLIFLEKKCIFINIVLL